MFFEFTHYYIYRGERLLETEMDNKTKTLLRQLAERYETADFLNDDPSRFMHSVSGEQNRVATAFIASCLSYGSRSQFMPRIGSLIEKAGGEMHDWIVNEGYEDSIGRGKECFYRLHSCSDVSQTLSAYRAMIIEYGDMKAFIAAHASNGREAIAALCHYFAAHNASALVPKNDASACKRVCMFLRWMVRNGSPVDLGIWSDVIDKRTLVMPLDTHVVQEATRLHLLHTRSASMNTAVRLTETMREAFPDDPLKGDFALFGLGVDSVRKE